MPGTWATAGVLVAAAQPDLPVAGPGLQPVAPHHAAGEPHVCPCPLGEGRDAQHVLAGVRVCCQATLHPHQAAHPCSSEPPNPSSTYERRHMRRGWPPSSPCGCLSWTCLRTTTGQAPWTSPHWPGGLPPGPPVLQQAVVLMAQPQGPALRPRVRGRQQAGPTLTVLVVVLLLARRGPAHSLHPRQRQPRHRYQQQLLQRQQQLDLQPCMHRPQAHQQHLSSLRPGQVAPVQQGQGLCHPCLRAEALLWRGHPCPLRPLSPRPDACQSSPSPQGGWRTWRAWGPS